MKVVVNFDRCMGNGVCEAVAPHYFSVGDDGVVIPPEGEIPPQDDALVRDAVESCPAKALAISDNETDDKG
ncbi:ferredoxin [Mycobacterium sp. 1274756.6]|uniref:ferredoxin n=1 Tax=Mycobacterium sp. 1274756.6 TaxID=1834076 RepID=UPI0007FE17D0|nr:ferredoxin [Mycobacterium sp. 1274756.6]OBJ73705.1 hypothetical protein A5643_02880 [Mycobacterium sp. 1274756.6]